ncbi:PP2C family serine/threonine-protein phosphatase [Streptomonospora sp. PA3]|uniref:protein phosphatase 2C domain-containing protein n=1 Tax=Streptomonospora sp. PA3 TaxID=2607326 RepID=UPI001642C003
MLTCPVCGEAVAAEDFFCEHCGHALRATGNGAAAAAPAHPAAHAASAAAGADPAPCARCGARLEGGTCTACGLRRRPGDHSELSLAAAAGVSDRGLHHERNEDAMALRVAGAAAGGRAGDAGSTVAAVVCDGVSSSPEPDSAAAAAAAAGSAALAESLEEGVAAPEALSAALLRASRAVAALADSAGRAPACTFVGAAVPAAGGPLAVGWVGDSRAYWLGGGSPAAPSSLLTRDDSWSEAMVAMSMLSPQEAARSPQAHALTAWLGADYGHGAGRVASFDPGGAGRLVLCSDGLWNYVPDPQQLAELVESAGPDPLAAARACVRHALRRGGRDNVTAVVIDVPAAGTAGEVP